jgi:hypothetical protein
MLPGRLIDHAIMLYNTVPMNDVQVVFDYKIPSYVIQNLLFTIFVLADGLFTSTDILTRMYVPRPFCLAI